MVPAIWLTGKWPAHVWIGCTVEDQQRAEERLPHLLKLPAPVRFVSYEPALGPVDFSPWLRCQGCDRATNEWHQRSAKPGESGWCPALVRGHRPYVNWLIIGGESGAGHRPMDMPAAEAVARQCIDAGVPLFVKQDSGPRSGLQGRWPADLWAYKQHPAVTHERVTVHRKRRCIYVAVDDRLWCPVPPLDENETYEQTGERADLIAAGLRKVLP